jgi:hypothetical protein
MQSASKVSFLHGDRVVATASVDAQFGRRNFQNVNEDAKYLSDPQFRVFRTPDGNWNIEHLRSAQNETVVDGRSLKEAMPLESGMTVAVGNMAKEIIKFELTVEVSGAGKLPPDIRETPAVDVKADSERRSPPEPEVPPEPKRPDRKPIDWSKVGTSVARGVRNTAAVLGPSVGAVFTSLLSGGSGSGGGARTVIHRGDSLYGEVILTIDGTQVHEGNSNYSQVLMTIDGDKIRRGNSVYGDVLASVDGQSVKDGNSIFGTSIAMIDGDSVKEGASIFGTTIAKIEGGGRMAGAAAAVFLLRM